ncbi:hypothetical protein BOX15_Mlig004999g2 [Macrostomum lignano]|uniref:Coiled-coil domain-containing protein 89 n=2 Tax=Macrostomum lignano TaxID=282301 RepID=A0A267E5E7_9PLAT|nr:hypothetical protein BOX15_Mlig004999g2 [Macrostomum lignano]
MSRQQQQQPPQLDVADLAGLASHAPLDSTGQPDAELQQQLGRLRHLEPEDKSELGLLRSRVEDQSHLIMMLKQRSDENLMRAQTQERLNKQLEEARAEAEQRLERELQRFRVLEEQFETLSSNHEQLIQFNNEHKQQKEWLQKENTKLRDHFETLVAARLRERDAETSRLTERLATAERQLQESRQEAGQTADRLNARLAELSARAERLEADAAAAKAAVRERDAQLAELRAAAAAEGESGRTKLAELTKEKDSLLTLSMERGRLCEEKQRELKAARERQEVAERRLRELQDRYSRDTEAVSSDAAVKKLRADLEFHRRALADLRQEFSAYKVHAGSALKQEKEINARLRSNIA